MKINIVTVKSGWILQKIADRIARAGNREKIADFTLSHHPTFGVDANFYCDVQNCFEGPLDSLDIGLFTHVHENDMRNVNPLTYDLDYIFHMAHRYLVDFATHGYSPGKMGLMTPWELTSEWTLKKPTIGIFQRGKYEGKGFNRMLELFKLDVAREFSWRFVGNDWEDVVRSAPDVQSVILRDENLSYPTDYIKEYQKVDYVLIPSEWEGGPIASLEALAQGIPVISSAVGWMNTLDVDIEIYRSTDALRILLENKIKKIHMRRESVKDFSYAQCARQIVEVIKRFS